MLFLFIPSSYAVECSVTGDENSTWTDGGDRANPHLRGTIYDDSKLLKSKRTKFHYQTKQKLCTWVKILASSKLELKLIKPYSNKIRNYKIIKKKS